MASANARSLALFLALVAPTGSATAQDSREYFEQRPTGKAEGTQFVQKGDESKTKADDMTPYQVSCWQNGIKIVDEANWRSPQLQSRFVSMKPMNGNEPGLYLVDFFNTFCEIRKR